MAKLPPLSCSGREDRLGFSERGTRLEPFEDLAGVL